jgi:hypothetical protein
LAVLFGRLDKGANRPTPACILHPVHDLSKPAQSKRTGTPENKFPGIFIKISQLRENLVKTF